MPYLFSPASSTPNPTSIRLVSSDALQTIPRGIKIPESWHDAYAEEHGILPKWAPRFTDPPDVEERLGKDIEQFSCQELENHLQTENFGAPIHIEEMEHLET